MPEKKMSKPAKRGFVCERSTKKVSIGHVHQKSSCHWPYVNSTSDRGFTWELCWEVKWHISCGWSQLEKRCISRSVKTLNVQNYLAVSVPCVCMTIWRSGHYDCSWFCLFGSVQLENDPTTIHLRRRANLTTERQMRHWTYSWKALKCVP